MEKTYYLVHIYFGKKSEGEGNHYTVYSYQKSRRFTARQAWNYIGNEKSENVFASSKLPANATIENYWNIIESLGLDKKVCDRYCTMGFM